MSSSNAEVVSSMFPAEGVDMVEALPHMRADEVKRAGIDGGPFAQDFATEFVAGQADPITPESPGVAGMAEGWANWLEPFDSYLIVPERIVDAGDVVLMLVHVTARTTRDGVELEHEPAAVFRFQDGQVRKVGFYLERERAFEVAGLPPDGDSGGGPRAPG